MRALPIFVFSFTCHQNIISISNELARPTPRRVMTLVAAAVGAAAAVYLAIAHAGYFTFGDLVRAAAPRIYDGIQLVSHTLGYVEGYRWHRDSSLGVCRRGRG